MSFNRKLEPLLHLRQILR